MWNELAKANPGVVAIAPTVDEETLRQYLFGLKDPINEKQQNLFLQIAQANNLNPFKREIYAVWFGDNFSIVTWYQVYIDKANATGLLNWWACEIIKSATWEIEWAKVIIHRKDWDKPFEWIVDFDEFANTYFDKITKKQVLNKIWKTKGKFMIKKVAIGQGFRLCFPSELWSLPYLAEEIANQEDKNIMDGQIVDAEVEDQPETPATVVPDPAQEKEPAQEVVPSVDPIKDGMTASWDPIDQPGEITTEDVADVFDQPASWKLPANKVKQVQIKWKEFAEKSGWNFEESEKKRKATMFKYYKVDSTNDLTVDQADDFVKKIDQAIEKILY